MVIETVDPQVATLRAERESREQARSIREQQDEAYQASLRADREKVRGRDSTPEGRVYHSQQGETVC